MNEGAAPRRWARLSENDNVAVALVVLDEGEIVQVDGPVQVRETIQFGHKFATRNIGAGDHVIKHDETIGVAISPIRTGDHVHVHNLRSLRARQK